METQHHQIVVIGGGTAGITVAAQLLGENPNFDIAIIEPAETHYYQPAWTLVGAGTYNMAKTAKPMKEVIPPKAKWIKEVAAGVDPDNNRLLLQNQTSISYDYLIPAPGIQLDWDAVPGLKEGLGTNGICSNYALDKVHYTWENLQNFQGGNMLFTQAAGPLKCAGAPQKIMYLAEHYLRKNNRRESANVIFASPGTKIFGVEEIRKTLEQIVKERNIHTRFFHKMVEIRPDKKQVVYELTDPEKGAHYLKNLPYDMFLEGENRIVIPFDMMHTSPPQSAPDFLKNSPLAVPDSPHGFVDVDKHSLQHKRYPNVFSLGDACSTPNAKTGAAVRKQAPVLVSNLLAHMKGEKMDANYQGYGSCPMVTEYGKMVLAEFDYNNQMTPTFPIDQSKERWSMWLVKKYGLPWLYWNRMLKGKA